MAKVKHPFYQVPQSMMPGYSGLSPTQFLAWMMIWSWTKEDRVCFMSNARFAKELNVSERQVKNLLKQLKELGLVILWYSSFNGSSKTRCLRAVLKPSTEVGSGLPHVGIELSLSGQESVHSEGAEVPFAGEVSFTHTRIDTTSTTTSSIKEDEGSQNEVELLFRQLGKNKGVSMTTVKEWYQSFSSDHLKNGVWVDTDGKPLSKVQAYAAKNFEFRLEMTKQNYYQRPKRKLDAKQIEADIRWHKRRADAWSKNPDKRHLVEGECQQIMHLQNQLEDIT